MTCKSDCSDKMIGNYSSKIKGIVKEVRNLKMKEPTVKVIVFSNWDVILNVIATAFDDNAISYCNATKSKIKFVQSIMEFKQSNVTCLLLPLSSGSKGLNLIEATHVFLVEPILNLGEELQAIGRVHRIGQTK